MFEVMKRVYREGVFFGVVLTTASFLIVIALRKLVLLGAYCGCTY
jgi:hypothetical protein